MGFGFQADFSADAERPRQSVHRSAWRTTRADVEFAASTELGALDDTRLAVPGGVFVGEAFTELETLDRRTGFFISATRSRWATPSR